MAATTTSKAIVSRKIWTRAGAYLCSSTCPSLRLASASPESSQPPNPQFCLSSPHTNLFRPFNKLSPHFLRSPTWQLSQSATPLCLPKNLGFIRRQWDMKGSISRTAHFRLPRDTLLRVAVEGPRVSPVVKVHLQTSPKDSESLFNAPNLISISRIVAGPFLSWMILNGYYNSALAGLTIAGATDWLDGYVARKMKINSVIGSYLDPFADKVLIVCVILPMIKQDMLSSSLVALVVARDCALVGGAFYTRASSLGWEWNDWRSFFDVDRDGAERVKPLFISKVNTVLQLALVGYALFQPNIGTDNSLAWVTYLSWLVGSTTLASWAGYGQLLYWKGYQTGKLGSKYVSVGNVRNK